MPRRRARDARKVGLALGAVMLCGAMISVATAAASHGSRLDTTSSSTTPAPSTSLVPTPASPSRYDGLPPVRHQPLSDRPRARRRSTTSTTVATPACVRAQGPNWRGRAVPDRTSSTAFYFESIGLTNRPATPCTLVRLPRVRGRPTPAATCVAIAGAPMRLPGVRAHTLLAYARAGDHPRDLQRWSGAASPVPGQRTLSARRARPTSPRRGASDHLDLVVSVRGLRPRRPEVNVSVAERST